VRRLGHRGTDIVALSRTWSEKLCKASLTMAACRPWRDVCAHQLLAVPDAVWHRRLTRHLLETLFPDDRCESGASINFA